MKVLVDCYHFKDIIKYFIQANNLTCLKDLGSNFDGFCFSDQILLLVTKVFGHTHAPMGAEVLYNPKLFNFINETVTEIFNPENEIHLLRTCGPLNNVPVYRLETKRFRFDFGNFFHCFYYKKEEDFNLLSIGTFFFDIDKLGTSENQNFQPAITFLFPENVVTTHGLVLKVALDGKERAFFEVL
jgi:hypothetical protein